MEEEGKVEARHAQRRQEREEHRDQLRLKHGLTMGRKPSTAATRDRHCSGPLQVMTPGWFSTGV
jgi:hypothetical protein